MYMCLITYITRFADLLHFMPTKSVTPKENKPDKNWHKKMTTTKVKV